MQIKFGWIGWNQKDGSDKIWGYLWAGQDRRMVHVFWGRRGKNLSFKTQPFDYALMNLVDSKNRKGYIHINQDEFLELWPDFYEICEHKLVWHVLKQPD
jgi:predicted DNA-binding WGR domain protein